MIPKLNLVSALAALVFFFLPWVSIECRGERMATQTGLQMVIGSGTPENRTRQGVLEVDEEEMQSLGHSYLAAVALIAIIGALLMALASLIVGRRDLDHGCGVLCAAALVCLVLQFSFGFPAQKAIRDDLLKPRSGGLTIDIPLGEAAQKEVLDSIRVIPLPWFRWELAALALPTLILGNAFLDRIKAKER